MREGISKTFYRQSQTQINYYTVAGGAWSRESEYQKMSTLKSSGVFDLTFLLWLEYSIYYI